MTGEPSQPPARRPVLRWFAEHPKSTAAIVLVFLLLFGCLLLDRAARRRVADRLAAIRASGAPVTIHDLAALMPEIPDDENMAVQLIRRAQVMRQYQFTEEELKLLPFVGSANVGPPGRRLPPDQLAAARAYLDRFESEVAGLHEALRLKRGCAPVQWPTPAMTMPRPELAEIRHAQKVLALECTLAAESSDRERAGAILAGMLRMREAITCQPDLLPRSTEIDLDTRALNQMELVVNLCGLSDDELSRLQATMARPDRRIDYRRGLIGERVILLDVLDWAYTCNPVLARLPAVGGFDQSACLDCLGEVIDSIGEPDAVTLARVRNVDARYASPPWYCIQSRFLAFGWAVRCQGWFLNAGLNRAMQAALACERFRLRQSRWPDALSDLVPEFLAEVPLDPFDGKPIRYARIAEGVQFWTIGEDEYDQGGDIQRLNPRRRVVAHHDHGWILLDPERRPLYAPPADAVPPP